jgi:hypothetical protein
VPSFHDPSTPEHCETQYFEMLVNRGIYHKGWTACTIHSIPWIMTGQLPALDDDVWELYGPDDWSQAHDLSREMPDKLHELQRLFLIEAVKYNVLPLDDRKAERFNPEIAGRPQLIRGNTQVLFSGMRGLAENIVLNIKNKSHAVTAQIVVPDGGARGVIIAQGGLFGGWSLYAKDGRPAYCYNLFGLQRFKIEGDTPIPPGQHQIRMEFAYDGGGLAKGGTVTLYLDASRPAKDAWTGPSRWSSPATTRPMSAPTSAPASATTTDPKTRRSAGESTGSRSTSATTPKTPTTSSHPKNAGRSPWPASRCQHTRATTGTPTASGAATTGA